MVDSNSAELEELPNIKKAFVVTLSLYAPDENILHDWVLTIRHSGYIVTHLMIQVQAQ